MQKKVVAALALLCVVPLAIAQAVGERDGMLADGAGRTLYIFDKDSAGKSHCNDACAVNWPPFLAADGAVAKEGYSVVTRDDGSRQWAYMSKPLYYFVADGKPGDRLGDGKNNVWHVVRPGKMAAQPAAPQTTQSYY